MHADHDDVSTTFIRIPNELKLVIAEELETHDINALATTCREMNKLLVRFMYSSAKTSTTKRGRSYFLLAVDHGNLTAVERFIEVGASVNTTDMTTARPATAIHSCAHFGHVEIAEFLIAKGVNVSAVDRLGRGALHSVVMGMYPKEAMLKLLVEAGAEMKASRNSVTELHEAAATGNVRLVQWLLDLGADPNAADRFGTRPVHTAAAYSNGATVRCLLEAGQNVQIADHHGRTPLHVAAQCGTIEGVKVLLEMGANVSSTDINGLTPLEYALYTYGNKASVHRILHLGASMADQLRETRTCTTETNTPDGVPSYQPEERNHMTIEILLAAGTDIAKVNIFGGSPLRWAAACVLTTPYGPRIFGPRRPNYLIQGDYPIRDPTT